jgi:hypothetical protein
VNASAERTGQPLPAPGAGCGRSASEGRGSALPLCLIVFLAAAVLNLAWLGRAPLFDTTEARHAEVAREFAADGHWLVPTLNGWPHLTKPPLTDWLADVQQRRPLSQYLSRFCQQLLLHYRRPALRILFFLKAPPKTGSMMAVVVSMSSRSLWLFSKHPGRVVWRMRLEQEMVLVAQRLDIDEEMDRLTTHVTEVERVLGKREPAGRRLDFLMQELNREANTLSSKSADSELTSIAVDMKVLIEQMREQVQNIE